VDEFTILEHVNWDRAAVHVAMLGDLVHGRTAHSKVDGLRIFHKVRVDLVAPALFEYPVEYLNQMRAQGFEVREFSSVEAYLSEASGSLAPIWWFFQPQFKYCGDLQQETLEQLRSDITFRSEWRQRLPEGTCFFQTLPRDKEHPIIPLSFDGLSLNGWDRVVSNAYYLHVVVLGMLLGKVGAGLPKQKPASAGDLEIELEEESTIPYSPFSVAARERPLPKFVEAIDLRTKDTRRRPERVEAGGPVPLTDGLVIDHIGVGTDPASCWRRLRAVRTILGWSDHVGSEGVYTSNRGAGMVKGIMSLPGLDFETVTVPQLKALASIAPGCTTNAVRDSAVIMKYRLSVPQRIYNLPNIRCKNERCISHPQNRQRDVVAFFERVPFYETSALPRCRQAEFLFVCRYCKWPHQYEDIWTGPMWAQF
jgi:aspartate carbamoyltransferase